MTKEEGYKDDERGDDDDDDDDDDDHEDELEEWTLGDLVIAAGFPLWEFGGEEATGGAGSPCTGRSAARRPWSASCTPRPSRARPPPPPRSPTTTAKCSSASAPTRSGAATSVTSSAAAAIRRRLANI